MLTMVTVIILPRSRDTPHSARPPNPFQRLAEGLTRCKYSGKTAGTVHIASATASDRAGSRTALPVRAAVFVGSVKLLRGKLLLLKCWAPAFTLRVA